MKAIIMHTGFLQGDFRNNGFDDGHFNHVLKFSRPGHVTVYHPRSWKTNVKNVLEQLHIRGITSVALISYSHGSAASREFALLAPLYGIRVDLWLVCDGVHRPEWAPRLTFFQLAAAPVLFMRPTIWVPPSVKRVNGVYQDITWPKGCPFKARDEKETHVEDFTRLTVSHKHITHHPEWWAMVVRELDGWINPPKAIPVKKP
jgi:hypothetical protein